MYIYIKKSQKVIDLKTGLRTVKNLLHVVWRVSSYLLGVKKRVWYSLKVVSLKKKPKGEFLQYFLGYWGENSQFQVVCEVQKATHTTQDFVTLRDSVLNFRRVFYIEVPPASFLNEKVVLSIFGSITQLKHPRFILFWKQWQWSSQLDQPLNMGLPRRTVMSTVLNKSKTTQPALSIIITKPLHVLPS